MVPYLAFSLFGIPLALTRIQILSIDMGTDTLTALGLGVESPAADVMRRPPRSARERLFDWPLASRAYLFLGVIEAVAAMGAFFFVLHGAGWSYGERLAADDPVYLQATTACLVAIVVMQIVNVFLCRIGHRLSSARDHRLAVGPRRFEAQYRLVGPDQEWHVARRSVES